MEKLLQTPAAMQKTLERIVYEIAERHENLANIAFLGIRTRGVFLARRLKKFFDKAAKQNAPIGEVDITLYRDDLSQVGDSAIVKGTDINFDITGKNIIMVDDVLYTGRTIRAALTELADFGRPATIELAVLIDRGHRELPIAADYIGKKVPTARKETVQVKLKEHDGADSVTLGVKNAK